MRPQPLSSYSVFLLAIRFHLGSAEDVAFVPHSGLLVSTASECDETFRMDGYYGQDIYASTALRFDFIRDVVLLCSRDEDNAGAILGIISQSLTTVDVEGGTVQALDMRKFHTLLVADQMISVPCADDFVDNAPEMILPEKFSMVMGRALVKSFEDEFSPKRTSDFICATHEGSDAFGAPFRHISLCVMVGPYLEHKEAILAEAWFSYTSKYILKKYAKVA